MMVFNRWKRIQRVMTEKKPVDETGKAGPPGWAFEEVPDPVIMTTADLNPPGPEIVAVNPAFCRQTQYAREELIGRNPRLMQGELTDRAVLAQLRAACARGDRFVGEVVNYRKDGSPYVVEWSIEPIRDGTQTVTHFIAVQRDVTSQRPFAERWLESEEKSREALELSSQHLAALVETVMVLEKTKRSFRSAELGALRQRLERLIGL